MHKNNGKLKVWGWITSVIFAPVGFVIALVLLSRGEKKHGGWMLGVMGGLVAIGLLSSGGAQPTESTGSGSARADSAVTHTKSAGAPKTKADKSATKARPKPQCGSRATDECTPRVGPDGRVRVDALYWNVGRVRTSSAIGDQQYGLGEKANGVYVVVDLTVRSAKNESATIMDNAVQLDANGKTYDPDSDGTIAAIGNGDDPLWFEDIGPDATVSSKVVFDVPRSALGRRLSMRFNELGFGTTHGYITLPSLEA